MIPYISLISGVRSNEYFAAAVHTLDGFDRAITIREQAEKKLTALSGVDTPLPPDPFITGKITDTWLKAKCENARHEDNLNTQRRVLEDLKRTAEADASNAVDLGIDDLLSHLNTDLAELIADAERTATELDGATTAAEAIVAGSHIAWAAMTTLADQYDQLRAAQTKLMLAYPDRMQSAITSRQDDRAASDLYVANLDEIWGDWKKSQRFDALTGQPVGNTPPWPIEPVAHLAWLATSDAQPWVPTLDDLDQLTARRSPAGKLQSLIVNTDVLNKRGGKTVRMI